MKSDKISVNSYVWLYSVIQNWYRLQIVRMISIVSGDQIMENTESLLYLYHARLFYILATCENIL